MWYAPQASISAAKFEMAVLKLMKLLYLAERRSFELYSEPIIGDRLVSMPHGPVLSFTFNHMNGQLESKPDGWAAWIGGRNDYMLGLATVWSIGWYRYMTV